MKATVFPFTRNVIVAIVFLYTIGFLIVFATVGLWEAMHRFVVEAILLVLWLWVSHKLLGNTPTEDSSVKRPCMELVLGLIVLALFFAMLTLYFLGTSWLFWLDEVVIYGFPLIMFFALRYNTRAMGLSIAPPRAWLVVLVVAAIQFAIGFLTGYILPPGELSLSLGSAATGQASSSADVLAFFGRSLLIAAIPEELFFRVYLQPRLAHYLPLGWAILIQALLFSAFHLPSMILYHGYSWSLALAEILSINNGLIGGYIWSRTRSLPLLSVLHLFAYLRF
ncbi:MAG: hypothetical protein AUJ21_06060 [Anaerolineae bacterium CG1_02_58_13]|nr:MAG: hypothetical protein AUJ21_06060 [Anaerolineae bacterium CG1_02_58_13]